MILIGITTNFSFLSISLFSFFSFVQWKRKSERDDRRKFNTHQNAAQRRCYTTMENIINTHIYLNHIKGGTEKWWDKSQWKNISHLNHERERGRERGVCGEEKNINKRDALFHACDF